MNLLFQDANLFFQEMNLLFQVMILLFQVALPEKTKLKSNLFGPNALPYIGESKMKIRQKQRIVIPKKPWAVKQHHYLYRRKKTTSS